MCDEWVHAGITRFVRYYLPDERVSLDEDGDAGPPTGDPNDPINAVWARFHASMLNSVRASIGNISPEKLAKLQEAAAKASSSDGGADPPSKKKYARASAAQRARASDDDTDSDGGGSAASSSSSSAGPQLLSKRSRNLAEQLCCGPDKHVKYAGNGTRGQSVCVWRGGAVSWQRGAAMRCSNEELGRKIATSWDVQWQRVGTT